VEIGPKNSYLKFNGSGLSSTFGAFFGRGAGSSSTNSYTPKPSMGGFLSNSSS